MHDSFYLSWLTGCVFLWFLIISSLFVWLISHQSAVLSSQNKPATSNQSAVLSSQNKPATSNQSEVLFSQNKSAPATSHQPNEQTVLCHVVLVPTRIKKIVCQYFSNVLLLELSDLHCIVLSLLARRDIL
jgi:hypothetical protein